MWQCAGKELDAAELTEPSQTPFFEVCKDKFALSPQRLKLPG